MNNNKIKLNIKYKTNNIYINYETSSVVYARSCIEKI